MKKSMILTIVLTFVAFTLFAQMHQGGPGMGQGPRGNGGPGMGRHMNHDGNCEVIDELKLTPDQQKQIKALRADHMKKMNTWRTEVENLRIDQRGAMNDAKYDDAKKLVDQITAKEAVMEKERIDHMSKMMGILTADQKKVLEEKGFMGKERFCNPEMKGDRPGKGKMNGPRHDQMNGNCEDCDQHAKPEQK